MTGETSQSGSTEKAAQSITKVFRDLTVYGDPRSWIRWLSGLKRLADGWHRDRERETRLWNPRGQSQFCFVRRSSSEFPAIALLMCAAGCRFSVANIVADGRALCCDEYNAILAEFDLKFLRAAASEAGLAMELSSDERSFEEAFGWAVAKSLESFSIIANRSRTHPADLRRWMEFLIQLHSQPNRDHDFDLLAKWLLEDGWSVDKTHKLISEWEFAGNLLRAYDEKLFGIGAGDRAPTIRPNRPSCGW